MAFVPGFEHDVFISYAQVDNVALRSGDEGWVTQFHRSLEAALRQVMGKPAGLSVWRDPKLQGNDLFDATLVSAFARSATMIAVESPSYVQSEWCRKEIAGFCAARPGGLGLTVGDKARLFRVALRDVPDADVPSDYSAVSRRLLGYRFHERDAASGVPTLFQQTKFDDPDQRYWRLFERLASELGNLLKQMARRPPAAALAPTGPVVYLAEVTDDLDDIRSTVATALAQLGNVILPRQQLPAAKAEVEAAVRPDLAQARVAVHLVGALRGKGPADDQRSYTMIQHDLAEERAGAADLKHLVWLPPELDLDNVTDPRQKEFLTRLAAADGPRLEVLKVGVQELIRLACQRVSAPAVPSERAGTESIVYISCQSADQAEITELENFFGRQQIGVVTASSLPGTAPASLREQYKEIVRLADGLVFVYARLEEQFWVTSRLIEARTIAAVDAVRPAMPMALFHAPPVDKPLLRATMSNVVVVDCREGFREERLLPFLQLIRAATAATVRTAGG